MRQPRTPPPPDVIQEQMVREYLAGEDMSVLAARYATTRHHVLGALRRRKVPRRAMADVTAARNRATCPPIEPDRLRELVALRLTIPEMARSLGASPTTVERRMRDLGLRSQHGRGSPLEKNYFWKGGRAIDDDGYILLKSPGHPFATKDGYVREHRLVMEEVLGRYLNPAEVVHHRDRNKQNNRPDNLRVYRTNGEHLRDELTGKIPNYTPEGLQRMRENALAVNRRRSEASRKGSGTGAAPSLLPGDHSPE